MITRTAQFDLRGKVVAITGGARGIGLATANAFAHGEVPWSRSATSMQQALVSPPRASTGDRSETSAARSHRRPARHRATACR
jgi:NAD(P)-dependent dehydrogenase (short-subunit alcohol dehydrogenase family)